MFAEVRVRLYGDRRDFVTVPMAAGMLIMVFCGGETNQLIALLSEIITVLITLHGRKLAQTVRWRRGHSRA